MKGEVIKGKKICSTASAKELSKEGERKGYERCKDKFKNIKLTSFIASFRSNKVYCYIPRDQKQLTEDNNACKEEWKLRGNKGSDNREIRQ